MSFCLNYASGIRRESLVLLSQNKKKTWGGIPVSGHEGFKCYDNHLYTK